MKIAQRLTTSLWKDEELFRQTLEFMTAHRDAVDEITLFTEETHNDTPEKLERVREDLPVLRERIEAFHRAGFRSVGLNVLVTIGHIDESPTAPSLPYQKIVGYRGDVSYSCCCPNHEDFRAYIREKYRLYATAGEDFLWVDDDIKIFWNGVKFGCFCPECLRRFAEKQGVYRGREELVAEMEKPDAVELRAAWVADVRDRISELLADIRDAIRAETPELRLGFMTQRPSWSTYNGMDFPAWFSALDACMGRPGEGYYFDTVPENVLDKTLNTAQQAWSYPATVTDLQYELENYPDNTWQKSRRVSVAEVGLGLAAGMNAALLNDVNRETAFWGLAPLYETIARMHPVWDEWVAEMDGKGCRGIWPAFSEKYDARRTLHHGESFFNTFENSFEHNVTRTYSLARLGLPYTMDREHADAVLLAGNLPEGFTDEELLKMLSGAVIVDGDAVEALTERGFGKYLGVERAGEGVFGLKERYLEQEPENKNTFGIRERDVHPAFFGGSCKYFRGTDPRTRVLSVVETREGEYRGIGTSLFENELGGRVCVLGYSPFEMANDVNRFFHLEGICDTLLGKSGVARLRSPGKTALIVRGDERKTGAAVMNLLLDPQEEIKLEFPGMRRARLLGNAELPAQHREGESLLVSLRDVKPYEVQMLIVE